MADPPASPTPDAESFVSVARLYVGNILYAVEMAAVALDDQGRREDAAWYRGLGRKLADAYGRERDS